MAGDEEVGDESMIGRKRRKEKNAGVNLKLNETGGI